MTEMHALNHFSVEDVARQCGIPVVMLRYWESVFPELGGEGTPKTSYSSNDIRLVWTIKKMIYVDHLTLEQARERLHVEHNFPVSYPSMQAQSCAPKTEQTGAMPVDGVSDEVSTSEVVNDVLLTSDQGQAETTIVDHEDVPTVVDNLTEELPQIQDKPESDAFLAVDPAFNDLQRFLAEAKEQASRVDTMAQRLTQVQLDYQASQEQLTELMMELDAARQALLENQAKNEALTQQIQMQTQQLADAEALKQKMDQDCAQLRQQVTDLEAFGELQSEEIQTLKQQLSMSAQKIVDLEEVNQSLDQQLAQEHAQCQRQEVQISELTSLQSNTAQTLAETESSLSQNKEALSALTVQEAKLRETYQALQQAHDVLTEEKLTVDRNYDQQVLYSEQLRTELDQRIEQQRVLISQLKELSSTF